MSADGSVGDQAAVDITNVPLHLGPGGTARPIDGFSWERIDEYAAATADDGADGRMVAMFEMSGSWSQWEMHPIGAEVVICCTGRHRFVQQIDGEERVVELGPGEALINAPGVWHTNDSLESGWVVTITSGQGTEHRPR